MEIYTLAAETNHQYPCNRPASITTMSFPPFVLARFKLWKTCTHVTGPIFSAGAAAALMPTGMTCKMPGKMP